MDSLGSSANNIKIEAPVGTTEFNGGCNLSKESNDWRVQNLSSDSIVSQGDTTTPLTMTVKNLQITTPPDQIYSGEMSEVRDHKTYENDAKITQMS